MPLFGFDAMQDWERAESELQFWCYAVVLTPVLLWIVTNVLLQHIAWPRTRKR
ncbi:hypothetical protein VT84_15535 [Gemmata sp. SH-PL17]|nr:hypothetical protein VT84_15535 [Gemmata sp. SH-PL17]